MEVWVSAERRTSPRSRPRPYDSDGDGTAPKFKLHQLALSMLAKAITIIANHHHQDHPDIAVSDKEYDAMVGDFGVDDDAIEEDGSASDRDGDESSDSEDSDAASGATTTRRSCVASFTFFPPLPAAACGPGVLLS